MGYFWGWGRVKKTVLGSTHGVEQLLIFIVPSILTFYVDLILGTLLTCWGPNGLFLGLGSPHHSGSKWLFCGHRQCLAEKWYENRADCPIMVI